MSHEKGWTEDVKTIALRWLKETEEGKQYVAFATSAAYTEGYAAGYDQATIDTNYDYGYEVDEGGESGVE